MFDRKRPCSNCPFRVGMGSRFRLRKERLEEINSGEAFQCHKTADYDTEREDGSPDQGDHPQQCAGLMGVQMAEGRPNTITQIATRLRYFDPQTLETSKCYASWNDVLSAHLEGREPKTTN